VARELHAGVIFAWEVVDLGFVGKLKREWRGGSAGWDICDGRDEEWNEKTDERTNAELAVVFAFSLRYFFSIIRRRLNLVKRLLQSHNDHSLSEERTARSISTSPCHTADTSLNQPAISHRSELASALPQAAL
jgi:hypothetical protein